MELEEIVEINGVVFEKGKKYRVIEENYVGYFIGMRKKDGLLYFGKSKEEWDSAYNPAHYTFEAVD